MRRDSREKAFQTLFMMDALGVNAERAVALFKTIREDDPPSDPDFYLALVRGVEANRGEIDALISGAADNWRLERMAIVDRNILRLGIFEFRFSDTPHAVAINEAVELGKRFGAEETGAFVNGILDRIARIGKTEGKGETS